MTVFVCLGTIAELIKLAPVVLALRERAAEVVGIATGQNDLSTSDLYDVVFPSGLQATVMPSPPRATTLAFGWWAVVCLVRMPRVLRQIFRCRGTVRPVVIVHGDTVSTLIAAVASWGMGAEVVHIEAGLRSFRLLRPFPEEICRIGVSRLATWAFCPGTSAVENLQKSRIRHVINTHENTLADSQRLALSRSMSAAVRRRLPPRYFLFVCHRQENLFDRAFLEAIVTRIEAKAASLVCVAIIHQPAAVALERQGLLQRLQHHPGVITLRRQGYVDFTHILQQAEFIITDGGSNQEESSYLGKPCLILRRETERQEGLGENVVLSRKDPATIAEFFANPSRFSRPARVVGCEPSRLISQTLLEPPVKTRDAPGDFGSA